MGNNKVLELWQMINPITPRIIIFGILLGLTISAIPLLRLSMFDVRDLYTYGGNSDIFEVTTNATTTDRVLNKLKPITTVASGQMIGWETTVCFRPDVSVVAHSTFVLIRTKAEYKAADVIFPADSRPCGTRPVFKRVPPGIPPGDYKIERTVTLTPQDGSPRTAVITSLYIEVVEP